jgi:peptide/nickel transport system permease protein
MSLNSLSATAPSARVAHAGQFRLMWWRFRRHRAAVAGGIVVVLIYLVAMFAEFLATTTPDMSRPDYTYAPPQRLHLLDDDWSFGPHVYGYKVAIDPVALRRSFVLDPAQKIPVRLFAKGEPYHLWGLIPAERRLMSTADPSRPFYLLGADRLGRDVYTRLLYGTRISMSVGLVGVSLSLFLGVLLGGISGYYGGRIDDVIQRAIEILNSVPTIPLWMGLAAAVPLTWHPVAVYFAITLIISLIGWTGLARVVRGRFFALRNEDFVAAAKLDGAGEMRIILRHMAPSFVSHIIASATLAVPAMIIAETSLSFLGIGLQPPIVSWGVLLKEAQNIRAVATAPWLFWPGGAVVAAVLALSFLGDGLRDAADPYAD